jgi:DNA adenine methylase
MTQSFLRWAGSKRQLLPNLANCYEPACRRYVEPFVGSASLFFRLCPNQALLGDINAELMGTYAQVRDNVEELLRALTRFSNSREEYLAARSLDPWTLSPPMRAARFVYLNRFCFNGLYRTNRAGQFNVPYGGERSGRLPTREALRGCSQALQRAELVTASFEEVLEQVVNCDFVYMDPPYSVRSSRVFNEYGPATFTSESVQVLNAWLTELDRRGAVFLLSYAESTEAESLSDGFYSAVVAVQRNIAGFVGKRRLSNELLISNRPLRSGGNTL